MAKITKIKAAEASGKTPKATEKNAKKAAKEAKRAKKANKKPFILIRPLVYFTRYIRDSWREIRQVRWPSRKATWKLFFAILIYTVLFIALIMLLDALFAWIFKTVI